MTNKTTKSHLIELWVETPEGIPTIDVANEVSGEIDHVWGNADDERCYLREWKVRGAKEMGTDL